MFCPRRSPGSSSPTAESAQCRGSMSTLLAPAGCRRTTLIWNDIHSRALPRQPPGFVRIPGCSREAGQAVCDRRLWRFFLCLQFLQSANLKAALSPQVPAAGGFLVSPLHRPRSDRNMLVASQCFRYMDVNELRTPDTRTKRLPQGRNARDVRRGIS